MADVVVFVGNVFEQFIQERDLLKPSAVSIWFTVIVVVLGNLLKVSFVGNGNSSSIGEMCGRSGHEIIHAVKLLYT